MASIDEVQVKITAETTELEAQLAALKSKAEGTVGAIVNVRTLGVACAVLSLALLVIGIVLGVLTVRQNKALANSQAISVKQQQTVDQAQQRIEQRDAAWKVEQAKWEKERAEIKTAPQATRIIEKYIPQIAGQSVADVKSEEIAPEIRAQLPNAPSYVVKTEQAEVETAKAVQAGQECAANLLRCQQDGADLRKQTKALTADRDNWRDTANGGSVARRALHIGIVGACSAGGAGVGASQGSKGAAIGSLIGAVACAIFTK